MKNGCGSLINTLRSTNMNAIIYVEILCQLNTTQVMCNGMRESLECLDEQRMNNGCGSLSNTLQYECKHRGSFVT